MKLPDWLPQEVHAAWSVFSEEEQQELCCAISDDTGEFLGIGFTDKVTGRFTRYANPVKIAAVDALERQIRAELEMAEHIAPVVHLKRKRRDRKIEWKE